MKSQIFGKCTEEPVPASEDEQVEKYVGEYIHCLEKRGFSPRTVIDTRRRIQYFFNFLKEKKIKKIDRNAFKRYARYLKDEKRYKHYTIKGRIVWIRCFFRYLTETKRYLFNPAEDLELPKAPKVLPQDIPTAEEVKKILDSIETVTKVGKRRKAILELFYSTGIRANELLNLDLYDVDFRKKTIFIRAGKGNKDRVVPFGKKVARALKDYIHNVRKTQAEWTGEKKLFLSMWGNKFKYKELILVMGGARKGKRLRAHSLRHACAIGMLQNGADIRYIQELLGHSNVTNTQIYTRILPTHIQEVHAKYHPRARIKKKIPVLNSIGPHPN